MFIELVFAITRFSMTFKKKKKRRTLLVYSYVLFKIQVNAITVMLLLLPRHFFYDPTKLRMIGRI